MKSHLYVTPVPQPPDFQPGGKNITNFVCILPVILFLCNFQANAEPLSPLHKSEHSTCSVLYFKLTLYLPYASTEARPVHCECRIVVHSIITRSPVGGGGTGIQVVSFAHTSKALMSETVHISSYSGVRLSCHLFPSSLQGEKGCSQRHYLQEFADK